jgi:hypothetical protein
MMPAPIFEQWRPAPALHACFEGSRRCSVDVLALRLADIARRVGRVADALQLEAQAKRLAAVAARASDIKP